MLNDLARSLPAVAARSLHGTLEAERPALLAAIVGIRGDLPPHAAVTGERLAHEFLARLHAASLDGSTDDLLGWIATLSTEHRAIGLRFDARTLFVSGCALLAEHARPLDHDGAIAAFLCRLAERIDALLATRSDAASAEGDPERPPADTRRRRDAAQTALLALMAAHDPPTGAHARAVGALSGRIARALGLSTDDVIVAETSGSLHDVGNVSTPDEILRKPGPLTDEEWDVMCRHAAAGEAIVARVETLRRCAPIIRAHHERVDGSGYPDRRGGAAIPLIARIVAVADAYHAMVSDRPYRRARPQREAIDELKRGRGTQWDAAIVDVALGVLAAPQRRGIERARRAAAVQGTLAARSA